ncbi:MAG: copper homeostasis protein CutC [Lactobacillaceae bacterium]|jgi:copper homeostasis protein|nr:copper homeostasis protein CutC [Lactobacillaceae bacterium]
MIKEIALEDIDNIQKAIDAGANRVEVNDNLEVGGLTPSIDNVAAALEITEKAGVDLVVMVRPKVGNFVYSSADLQTMIESLNELKALGVKTVTFGAVTAGKKIDTQTMSRLLEVSSPMEVVFHMAFDAIRRDKQAGAINWLADNGVSRILTHGGDLSTPIEENLDHLERTIQEARGQIEILPGGGITFENYERVVRRLGVSQVHGSRIVKF